MQHFQVLAWDGSDAEAPARRQAAREAHLERARAGKASGQIIAGGPILNAEGGMIGSTMMVAMEDRAALDKWIADDPYTAGNVWQRFDIWPIRVAV